MRILFWSELFWPYIGGVEVMGTKLLLALKKRNYEFVIVTSNDYLDLPDEAEFNGIPIHRFPFRTALSSGDIVKLVEARQQVYKLKKNFAPELIHINSIGPSALFHLQTLDAHPAPFLVTLHTDPLPGQLSQQDTLQARLFNAASWVTSCSESALKQARRLRKEITNFSSVIYNGLEMGNVLPEQLPTDSPRFLCLGRLVPQKGFDLALSAFSELADRFPHARMTIAGYGPERSNLEKQASELGVSNSVEFIGWTAPDDIPSIINTATVVVMPSRYYEGLPLVAIQSALMARPVIATRVGGLPEVVEHRRTGLIIEDEDVSPLRDAMAYMLEYPEQAKQMGQIARSRANELFSFERHVNEYDELYRKLIVNGS
jgi:glycogen synthase